MENGLAGYDWVDSCFASWFFYVLVNVDYKNGLWHDSGGSSKLQNEDQANTRESFQESHQKKLHFCTDFTAHKVLKSEKVQAVYTFERRPRDVKKTEGLCFWAEKMNLFYPAKQTLAVY